MPRVSFLKARAGKNTSPKGETARNFLVITAAQFRALFNCSPGQLLFDAIEAAGREFTGWREIRKAAHIPVLIVNSIGVPVTTFTVSVAGDKAYLVNRSKRYGSLYGVEIPVKDAKEIINAIKSTAAQVSIPLPAAQVTQTAKTVSQSQVKAKRTLKRSGRIKNKARKIAQSDLSVKEKIVSIVNLEGEILRDELIELLPHNKAHVARVIKRLISENKITAVETDQGTLLVSTEEE